MALTKFNNTRLNTRIIHLEAMLYENNTGFFEIKARHTNLKRCKAQLR